MREEWRNDRTSYSHCAGTFDFRANRVNVKKTNYKVRFHAPKDFAFPQLCGGRRPKIMGVKKIRGAGGGGSGGKISPGGKEKKRVESIKGRRQFLVSLRARGGGGTSWLAGAHWYIAPLRECGRLLPHASSIVMHIIVLALSNQQIVCIDGLIVYFTMFYTPFV